MYPDNLARALSSQLDAERAIHGLTMAAFEAWLPDVKAAVLPTLTASAELPPDPDQVPNTAGAWELALDEAVLYGIGLLYGYELLAVLGASGAVVEDILDTDTDDEQARERPERPATPDELPNSTLAKQARKIVAASLGVSTSDITALDRRLASLPTVRHLQSEYLGQVRNRMVNTPEAVFRDITVQLDKAIAAGEGSDAQRQRVQQFLSPATGDWTGRAMTVARTESAGAMSHATIEAATLRNEVLEEDLTQIWICTLDSRTRKSHWAADGQRVPLGSTFRVGRAQIRYPGDPRGPAEEVLNCVVGSTLVEWPGQGISHATSRSYTGTFVELTTARGHVLTATANHPILTPSGYVPAVSLNPGDHVIASRTVDAPQVDDTPPRIDEVYRATREVGVESRVVAGAVDFHGDVAEGDEVSVVRADVKLGNEFDASSLRRFGDATLVGLGHRESLGSGARSGDTGSELTRGFSNVERDGSTSSVVSGGGVTSALFGSEPGHPDSGGLAATADLQATFSEVSDDSGSADAEALRHLEHARSLGMEPVELVSVEIYAGSHRVYNLTTSDNWYIGNGIAQHNCRCRVAVLAADEALPGEQDRHTERGPGDSTVRNRAGSQQDEIDRRAEEGNIRAREDPAGLGRVASIHTEEQNMADEETIEIDDTTEVDVDTPDTPDDAGEDTEGGVTFRTFTDSVIAVLGTPTDDRRILAADMDFRFRDFPLPVMWTKQSSEGHAAAYTVGVMETARIEDNQVLASGYLLNTDEADEAADQLAHGVTGPSVDLVDADWIYTNEAGEEITEEMWEDAYENGVELKIYETVTSAKLAGVTLVSTPAFGETILTLDPTRVTKNVAVVASLVAAAARPVDTTYDAALFANPQLDGPTPVTYDAKTGRIYGHLACFGQCHVGITDQCVVAPRSKTDYAHFHTSPPVLTTDGRLPVGRLTVGTGHAGPRLGARPAAEHYDNTGTCFALVRVGEDEHGIWFSGIPHPTATDEQIRAGLSAPLSGDWRTIGGNLELVAALAVNTPGFPVLVAGASDENDRPRTLVASLGPRTESKRTSRVDPKLLAQEVVREMRAQDRRNEQARKLLASVDRRREARAIIEQVGV